MTVRDRVYYRVDSTAVRVIAWVAIAGFVLFSFFSWREGQALKALFLLPFPIVLLYGVLTVTGTVEVATDHMALDTLAGRYKIKWDEVTHIEGRGGNLTFYGSNKHLTLPGPTLWNGPDKEKAEALMKEQMVAHSLSIQMVSRSTAPFSHNSRE